MGKRLVVIFLSAVILLLVLIIGILLGLVFYQRLPLGQAAQLSLTADRTVISPGECANLSWLVENAPFATATLNGESIASAGQKTVCPAQTTMYELKADSWGASFTSQLTITVNRESPTGEAGGGDIELNFIASPEKILRGECSTLRWEVLSPGEAQVRIQGEEFPRSGEIKICPEKSTDYLLEVRQREQTKNASAYVSVIDTGSSASSSSEDQEVPPPASSSAASSSASSASSSSAPTSQGVSSSAASSGKITTDLAITDLFIKAAKANVFIRITNNGPAGVSGLKVEIKCNEHGQPVSGGTAWSGVHAPVGLTVTLDPGQTAEFDTGSAIDTTQYSFQVTCGLSTGTDAFTDSKISNNNYSEAFPAVLPTVDLAVTDLYPDSMPQGKIYARITNNGPGSLSNTEAHLTCILGSTDYSTGAKSSSSDGPFSVTLSIAPGQTQAVDTHMTIDTSKFWYQVTCEVTSPYGDPNNGNDIYSETIPPPP